MSEGNASDSTHRAGAVNSRRSFSAARSMCRPSTCHCALQRILQSSRNRPTRVGAAGRPYNNCTGAEPSALLLLPLLPARAAPPRRSRRPLQPIQKRRPRPAGPETAFATAATRPARSWRPPGRSSGRQEGRVRGGQSCNGAVDGYVPSARAAATASKRCWLRAPAEAAATASRPSPCCRPRPNAAALLARRLPLPALPGHHR